MRYLKYDEFWLTLFCFSGPDLFFFCTSRYRNTACSFFIFFFLALYFKSLSLYALGFLSFDPLKKIARERSVGKIGKLVSLLTAEKQKVLKVQKVSRQWSFVLLVKWDWTESKTLKCVEVKVMGNLQLWVCSSKGDEHGQRSGKDSYIQCSLITQTSFFGKFPGFAQLSFW